MKRLATFTLAALLCCLMTGAAQAETIPDTARSILLYPNEVTEYEQDGHPRISKVYILSEQDDPADIPTADFEQEGRHFTMIDLTCTDRRQTDMKQHTEIVTVESKSKDMDDVLPLFPTEQEVTTEDGYSGLLTLAVDSIKAEAADYASSTRTVTATRTYPNLSDADVSLIPKTIEDNGRTLTLDGVQWQEAGGFFHATAAYSGKVTSRYVKGYTISAHYSGEVSKVISDELAYTAVFSGTPIQNEKLWIALPIGAIAAVLAAALLYGCGKQHKKSKEIAA